MIWLAPIVGTLEGSVYFDIRDIDVRRTGSGTEGVVGGIVGDGCCEFWGEVSLGGSQQVNILPFCDEEECLLRFEESVDLYALKKQLAESVSKVFSRIGQPSTDDRLQQGRGCPGTSPMQACPMP